MNEATRDDSPGIDPLIVSLDAGSSSVRALLFDGQGRQLPDFGRQEGYPENETADGGREIDADQLAAATDACVQTLHEQLQKSGRKVAGVGFSCFWHSFLGTGEDGRPTSPIYHLLDSRSASQVPKLRQLIDPKRLHERTGCVPHASYWPAKMLWLQAERPQVVQATKHWISFGEYYYQRLFGEPLASTSMVSATGLWEQNENRFDPEVLQAIKLDPATLPRVEELDQPGCGLVPGFRERWPLLADVPWYPAVGDGACSNVGSGCTRPERFCLTLGTTGALRAVVPGERIDIPQGLWAYRLDRGRFVLGGALSNGGEVYAWAKRTFALPAPEEVEKQLASSLPGTHGLTVLPLFAGERSPGWRADARAAYTGLSYATTPLDLLRASLEAVALRFRLLYDRLTQTLPVPVDIIASGGAVGHSPAWTQMITNALGHPVTASRERETSSRGAALLALERLRAVPDIDQVPFATGMRFNPQEEHRAAYEKMAKAQQDLYGNLYPGELI